jgi:signal-transduction protein with cAMP-binding, CBS, and nucleotidyltransferase domain
MTKPKSLSPDQLFAKAVNQVGRDLSSSDLRLLTSGLVALREAHGKLLNEIELKALSGMIAFVAYSQEANETTVMAVLSAHFGFEDIKMIPSRLYDSAMDFLMNVKMKHIVN